MGRIRIDIAVSSLGELQTVHVANYRDGANAWVDSELDYWTLEKNSGATVGADVIAPLPGSPQAGAVNARWIRSSGAGLGPSPLAGVIYREGAVDPAAPVYAHFPDAYAAALATGGPTSIVVDPTLGQPVMPGAIYDFSNIDLAGFRAKPTTLNVEAGTVFTNAPPHLRGELALNFQTTADVLVGTAANPVQIYLQEGSSLETDAACTVPPIHIVSGTAHDIQMDTFAYVGPNGNATRVVTADAGTVIVYTLGNQAFLDNNAVTGAGVNTAVITSPSAFNGTQAGAGNYSRQGALTAGIFKGSSTLVNGTTSAPVSMPGLQSTSVILVTVRVPTPGAGNLTDFYSALESDRVFGAAGSFKPTACISAGTINVADQSVVDWLVVL